MVDSQLMSRRLDAVIDRALAEKRVVGAVVLVAQRGKVVFSRAAGQANREARIPMSAGTVFRLSSLTKPIVSAAAMALIERGKLGLDDEVTRWLPAFRPKLPDGSTPAITVRQLLTHTAGLGYRFNTPAGGPYHPAEVSDGLDESPVTLEENVRRLGAVPLLYAPGTSWVYSLAIDVLGAVLEKAAGAPLADVVSQRITAPLAMPDTAFYCREPDRLAVPYVDGKPEPVLMGDPVVVTFMDSAIRFSPSRALNPRAYASGGVGMVGTGDDFMRFLIALLAGGGPVLKPGTVTTMMSNQIGSIPTLRGPGFAFGFGGAVITDSAAAQTPQSPGTFSWGGVYGHSWFVDPRKEVALLCMTNTAFEGMAGAITTQLRDAVYQD